MVPIITILNFPAFPSLHLNTPDLKISKANGYAHRTLFIGHAQSIQTNKHALRNIGHTRHARTSEHAHRTS